jgi:hypothetical protein
MERIRSRFFAEYQPGPVTLYLEDLESIFSEFGSSGLCDPHDRSNKPTIFVSTAYGRWARDEFTHVAESFEELREQCGERVTGSFMVLGGPPGLSVYFQRLVGIQVRGDGSAAEVPFHRITGILRNRRRWFWPLLRIPTWGYAVGLIAWVVRAGLPALAWQDASKWLLLALLVAMALGQAQWGSGAMSRIFVIRRHQRSARRALFVHDLWGRILSAVAGAVVTALFAKSCSPPS